MREGESIPLTVAAEFMRAHRRYADAFAPAIVIGHVTANSGTDQFGCLVIDTLPDGALFGTQFTTRVIPRTEPPPARMRADVPADQLTLL